MRYSDYGKDVVANAKLSHEKAVKAQEKLNAIVTMIDEEKEIERVSQLEENAPLYAIPVAIKDNISTCGIRTTASSRILDNYVPVF